MGGVLDVGLKPEDEAIDLPVEAKLTAPNGRGTERTAETDIRRRDHSRWKS
jgi:hypothetical protein